MERAEEVCFRMGRCKEAEEFIMAAWEPVPGKATEYMADTETWRVTLKQLVAVAFLSRGPSMMVNSLSLGERSCQKRWN
jgi:hypothetical protein